MEHCEVSRIILDVYETCNIKNFPIDCIDVIKKLKIPLYRYSIMILSLTFAVSVFR